MNAQRSHTPRSLRDRQLMKKFNVIFHILITASEMMLYNAVEKAENEIVDYNKWMKYFVKADVGRNETNAQRNRTLRCLMCIDLK